MSSLITASPIGQRCKFDTERSRSAGTFTGSFQTLGSVLTNNPRIVLLRNNTNVNVILSDDGSTNGYTFYPTERLVLDLGTNNAENFLFSWDIGRQFYVSGAAGAGSFDMSILFGGN